MRQIARPPRQAPRARAEKSAILRWLHPEGVSWGTDPGDFDPEHLLRVLRRVGPLFGRGRYFRLTAKGFENVPPSPAMMVSNHSGGTTVLDAWGLGIAWYRHFGVHRPLRPAAHEMVLGNSYTGPFFAKLGVLRADRELACEVLQRWRQDLLVMPGGDLDAWRPFHCRYKVRFSGRTGYASLALRAGVPIVPVAHVGAHHSLVVLSDGRRFAEWVGLPKVARAHIWPVQLSLPWGVGLGPMPHLPLPVHLRYLIGEPVWPRDVGLRPGQRATEKHVADLDTLVRCRLQSQLDRLRDGEV